MISFRLLRAASAVVMAALAASYASPGAKLVVCEPSAVGVPREAATAFGDLLRDSFRSFGYRVPADSPLCLDPDAAAKAARETAAEEVVVISVLRLDRRVIVLATSVDGEGRTLVTLRTSVPALEDLDPLSTRIASAITQRIGN